MRRGRKITHVNYQPVLHHANLAKNLCFPCYESHLCYKSHIATSFIFATRVKLATSLIFATSVNLEKSLILATPLSFATGLYNTETYRQFNHKLNHKIVRQPQFYSVATPWPFGLFYQLTYTFL